VKLSVLKRNQPIQKIDLGKDVLAFDYSETVFLIGRSKDCHVVLDDKQVSREHVRIIHKNGKWFCEKTAEHNACLYNGEDFTQAELEDGDSLTIGSFTINIENSSENTVQFTEAAIPAPVIHPIVEVKPVEPIQHQDQYVNNDETKEIPARIATSNDATAEIEIPSDFALDNQNENHSETSDNDDFNYESTGNEDTSALEVNSDEVAENESLSMENDDNLSYSLENIENEGDDEGTKIIQSFAKVQLELFGETAPYDKYLIENEKTYIGRDPSKCQIVLNDSEVSTVHAVITKNNVMLTIEDLNSSNGTLLNGDRINKAALNHNDEFVIGGVSFTVKVRSDFLKEENSTLMAVDDNQVVEVEEIVEVQAEEGENVDALGEMISDAPVEKSIIKRIWKDEEKRKKAIYIAVVLVGAWVMFGDDSSNQAPTAPKKTKKAASSETTIINKASGKKLSEEEKRALSARYEIGKNHYYNGRYREALDEFQKISATDPNFNPSLQSLIALSKEGLSKLEEQEKKRLAEQVAAEKKIKVKDLLTKAAEYVKDRRVEAAQDVFNEIAKIDPENIEITRMKLELEDWQKEKAKSELEAATKKKAREDKVEKLKPGKTLFLQKEWFKAIGKLDDFLKIKNMDEDLTKEASEMLKTSRDEISNSVAPLIGKAKSLMEGQDLKGAYEVYQQILKIEPSNSDALNVTGDIKDQLTNKARKIYREAIISESLSLFQDAKEKFQEVQQISPVDSDYYKKATDKLKDYLD
jgi:pSer/pThr/pTyr-binding forkhead associated (FHA) protein/tetratricopeptide (TPR) repeat protein